jgi:hypothetical protein
MVMQKGTKRGKSHLPWVWRFADPLAHVNRIRRAICFSHTMTVKNITPTAYFGRYSRGSNGRKDRRI